MMGGHQPTLLEPSTFILEILQDSLYIFYNQLTCTLDIVTLIIMNNLNPAKVTKKLFSGELKLRKYTEGKSEV